MPADVTLAAIARTAAPRPTRTRPFARFEWALALRYLRPRRRHAVISVIASFSLLGITLGVATLIIVMSVMNGFRGELIDRILGINGHLILQSLDANLTDYAAVADRIEGVDGVVAAVPIIEGQVLASAVSAGGALVRGIRAEDIPAIPGLADNVVFGTLDNFDASDGIAIGSRLAASLGVNVGGRVTLVSPKGPVTPFGSSPMVKSYPVAAIFEIGMSEYDATFVFMPFAEAQIFFMKPDQASAIEVYVADPEAVSELRAPIDAAAGRPLYGVDWRQRDMSFFSALEVERNVMFLILMLIVLVASLNIISGLTMLVKEKGRDIAILRTMGVTRAAILRVFFITGAAIGTVGTLAGLILGTIITLNIESIRQFISRLTGGDLFSAEFYFLSHLPADIDFGEVVGVVVMALGLSYLATLYPAWRAARTDPVEALRYE